MSERPRRQNRPTLLITAQSNFHAGGRRPHRFCWQIYSKGTPPNNRRSRRCGCRWGCETRLEYDLCIRWSDKKCSGGHQFDRGREKPLSGKYPNTRGKTRNGQPRADRLAIRRLCRWSPKTATSQIRVRRDLYGALATPDQRWRLEVFP